MTQNERVLEAFKSAPGKKLTTAQIDSIPYMTNQRARISDLRAQGHIIKAERIKGKNQSCFTYCGQSSLMTSEAMPKPWRPLFDGWEVQL